MTHTKQQIDVLTAVRDSMDYMVTAKGHEALAATPSVGKFGISIIHTDSGHKVLLAPVAQRLLTDGYAHREGEGIVATDADLRRAVEAGIGTCDFCSDDFPVRLYDVPDFALMEGHTSTGGWAACNACATLIDARDRDGLTKRAVDLLIHLPLPPKWLQFEDGLRQRKTAEAAEQAVRGLHEKFWLGLLAHRLEDTAVTDYAPGIEDVRLRVLAGANRELTGGQFTMWMTDLDMFQARLQRHEYSHAQASEMLAALEDSQQFKLEEAEAAKHEIARMRLLISRYHAGPSHLEALEQQWRSYAFNKGILGRVNNRQMGALQEATTLALHAAETYCWAPTTVQAVAAAGDGLPGECAMNATALGDLSAPGKAGWWWFQEPIPVKTTEKSGEAEPVVALLWRREVHPTHGPRVWFQTFVLSVQPFRGRDQIVAIPTMAWDWVDGRVIRDLTADYTEGYQSMRPEQNGFDHAGIDATVTAGVWFSRFFMAATMWLRQRVVIETPPGLGARQTGRRLQREHKLTEMPRVRIIELRRRETATRAVTAAPATPGRTLSCRFVVNGFTRNQWYASRGEHAPKWIESFVKGPKDAPFKDSAHVYVVRR